MGLDITGVGTAVTGIKDILGMFFPDKTEEEKDKMAQAFSILQLQANADHDQAAVNQAAASADTSGSMSFRDGAGWVCVIGLAVTILKPLIEWGATLFGHPIVLPSMDTSTTGSMLFGLLGLGSMHMNEAIKKNA